MSFLVVAYFTLNTVYEDEVKRLIASLMEFNIPYYIVPISDKGNWYLNTQYKPKFIKDMMIRFPDHSIVYVDCDAKFCRKPTLFEELDAKPEVNIGVHLLDHVKRGRQRNFELLSGTMYLKNNAKVIDIVNQWTRACEQDKQLWDQRALAQILPPNSFYVLPEEYCTIFDYMKDVKDPVILHYQASRKIKNKSGKLSELVETKDEVKLNSVPVPVKIKNTSPVPKKVAKGGLVRYRCTRRNI